MASSPSPSSFLHSNPTSKLYHPIFNFKHPSFRPLNSRNFTIIKASSDCNSSSNSRSNSSNPNPLISSLKTTTAAIVFTAAVFGKFHQLPAGACPQANSAFDHFLKSDPHSDEDVRSFLMLMLKNGEHKDSLKMLEKLRSAQPENTEWKFLMALLNEMDKTQKSREVFEEILERSPLSFEALFGNALLMDRCGEGAGVMKRLKKALKRAEGEKKVKEAGDVRFIMAQVQFLRTSVEEALKSCEELEKKEPKDFRPYFCRGMIYRFFQHKNEEGSKEFAKYYELSPKKF